MSRTLEKTLTMLLPTASGIDRELINLTNSYLSQSKHRISNLNSSEEPAREMICAHLACEKLKQKLALPSIKNPPAPIPPKLYESLYKQFYSVLFPSKMPVSTPQKPTAATPRSSRQPNAAATTPTGKPAVRLKNSLTQFRTAVPSQASNPLASKYDKTISSLCTSLSALNARKYIPPALSTISSSFKHSPLAANPMLLIGALHLVINQRLLTDHPQLKTAAKTKKWYSTTRSQIYDVLELDDEATPTTEFDSLVEELCSEDMLESAWFLNIPVGVGLNPDGSEDGSELEREAEGGEGDGEDRYSDQIVLHGTEDIPGTPKRQKRTAGEMERASGVGSMMQPTVDYLSEKRRAGFQVWKARVLEDIEAVP